MVAMADNDTPIICNGFKDAEFIEMAMLAHKIGRKIIPVVEKYTELDLILKFAEKIGVRPKIGMRVKLAARGSGRWQSSGGYRQQVRPDGHRDPARPRRAQSSAAWKIASSCCTSIWAARSPTSAQIKGALNEAVRVYTELKRQGAGLKYLDVGGGLGVDYDGSQTNFESSVNYTLQEYANDVVYHVQSVCDEAGVPHPRSSRESGRAVVAYHSVLVFGVLGVSGQGENDVPPAACRRRCEQPLRDLLDTYQNITVRNVLESYHDAQQSLDMAMSLFSGGLSAARAAQPWPRTCSGPSATRSRS